MSSRNRLLTLLALILLVALGWLWSVAAQNEVIETSSDRQVSVDYLEGACQEAGVNLVIDFGTASDREPIVRCARNFTGSGWELFKASGVIVEGTKQYPVGFACRIENFPTVSIQDCLDTPKYSEGSWGYFFLDAELGWRVSGVGSAARNPECGFAEGWLFLAPGEQAGEVNPRITPEIIRCD